MSHSKITKDHPKYSEYTALRDNLRKDIESIVNTWGDFEKNVSLNVAGYFRMPTEDTAAATVSFLQAVIYVLINNPEEGDIKKIVAQVLDTYVFRPDICGSDAVEVGGQIRAKTVAALSVMAKALEAVVSAPEPGSETTPPPQENKPSIH